ncbi:THAP domain-containing protein 11, partial [Folsomia candida]
RNIYFRRRRISNHKSRVVEYFSFSINLQNSNFFVFFNKVKENSNLPLRPHFLKLESLERCSRLVRGTCWLRVSSISKSQGLLQEIYLKVSRMTKWCCIPICGSSERDNGISFFSFPKDPASSDAWCKVLGITLNPSEIIRPHIKTESDLHVTAEDSLMSIISKQRSEIQELKKTNKSLQEKLRYSKSKRQKLDYATILDSFPGNESFAEFVNIQFERYNEKIHSRWSDKEKTLALSLYSRLSQKGYSCLLEMGFKLPPLGTIFSWLGKITGSPTPRRVGRPSVSKSSKAKEEPAPASEDIEDNEDDESMEDEEEDEKKHESDDWQKEWFFDKETSGKGGHYY